MDTLSGLDFRKGFWRGFCHSHVKAHGKVFNKNIKVWHPMPLHGSGRIAVTPSGAAADYASIMPICGAPFLLKSFDTIVVNIGFGKSSLARGLPLKKLSVESQKIDAW